jgi:anti-sigma factor RsiW
VDCTLDRHLLDGYLDGELGFERALEVEAHAASCRSCARELESWKEIRGALTRSDLYYRAPAALEEKIRRLAPRDPVAVRAPWLSRFTWAASGAAFATAILLLAFVTTYRGRPATDQVVGAGFVESHIRSLMSDHVIDVVSTDRHTVKPWFDGKIDFAPPVQDFAAQGYPLAGGRLDFVDGRKVAVLVYHRALHVIDVYVWPQEVSASASTRAESGQIRGYNFIEWSDDKFEYCAVSDLNAAELRDFSKLVSP